MVPEQIFCWLIPKLSLFNTSGKCWTTPEQDLGINFVYNSWFLHMSCPMKCLLISRGKNMIYPTLRNMEKAGSCVFRSDKNWELLLNPELPLQESHPISQLRKAGNKKLFIGNCPCRSSALGTCPAQAGEALGTPWELLHVRLERTWMFFRQRHEGWAGLFQKDGKVLLLHLPVLGLLNSSSQGWQAQKA